MGSVTDPGAEGKPGLDFRRHSGLIAIMDPIQKAAREARLEAALRENLRRRKAQARAKDDPPKDEDAKPT